jgi:hypothetical protein
MRSHRREFEQDCALQFNPSLGHWLEIKWPQLRGGVQRFTDVAADRYVTLVEGKEQSRLLFLQ